MHRKFVWGGTDAAGWLMLMELDGSDNLVRKYTWGLDLAGQHGSVNSLESAGGIGGLLAVAQAQVGGGSASGGVDAGDYVFTYDANGNVAQVLDLSAGSAATGPWTLVTPGSASGEQVRPPRPRFHNPPPRNTRRQPPPTPPNSLTPPHSRAIYHMLTQCPERLGEPVGPSA